MSSIILLLRHFRRHYARCAFAPSRAAIDFAIITYFRDADAIHYYYYAAARY